MAQYKFDSLQTTNVLIENGTLEIKSGLSKKSFSEKDIRYVYPHHTAQYTEVILHTVLPNGKTKNHKFYADANDPLVDPFLDSLVQKLGVGIDLRGKESKEALGLMKTANSLVVAAIALPIVILLAFAGFFAPYFVHGFDSGSATVTAGELQGGNKTGTSNLTITGHALSEAMEYSVRRKGSTTVRTYIPLVDATWEGGQTVHLLIETSRLTDTQFQEILNKTEFSGILRDRLWEGPHRDVIQFFEKEYGATFTEPVLLLDLDATPGEDRILAFVCLGIAGLILVGLAIYTIKRG